VSWGETTHARRDGLNERTRKREESEALRMIKDCNFARVDS